MSDSTDTDRCPQCGEAYKRVGTHWARSSMCDYPEPTARQRDLLDGILLTSGNVTRSGGGDTSQNPFFQIASVNKPFLDWLDDEFGVLTTGVREIRDSDAMQANFEKFDDVEAGALDNTEFSTEYGLNSRQLPFLREYLRDWYDADGNRHVPPTLDRTPLNLRVLYALSGQLTHTGSRHRITIPFIAADIKPTTLHEFFSDFGPSLSSRGDDRTVTLSNCQRFFEYIGDPIPGFEDKWLPPADLEEPDAQCPTCNGRYTTLSAHFTQSSACEGPSITPHQHELLSGALLSGAQLQMAESVEAAQLYISSTSEPYLDWLATELGWLANPVREDLSEADARAQFEKWTGRDDLDEYNINASHVFTTPMHPEIAIRYEGWFDNPGDCLAQFDPTPLRCKLIFGRRGTVLHYDDRTRDVAIHYGRIPLDETALTDFFEEFTPRSGSDATLLLKDTDAFLEYIGDPLPGCEGRWEGNVQQSATPTPD